MIHDVIFNIIAMWIPCLVYGDPVLDVRRNGRIHYVVGNFPVLYQIGGPLRFFLANLNTLKLKLTTGNKIATQVGSKSRYEKW
jgi:hypothetical protein